MLRHTIGILRPVLGSRVKLEIARAASGRTDHVMNVFDRHAKRLQRNRTALLEDYEVYEYIKEEVGWQIADRICDIKRKFKVVADVGCGRGYVSRHVYSDMVEKLYQMEIAEEVLKQAKKSPEVPTHNIIGDEEFLPFKASSLDLVTSCLSLHWVNDLPGALKQIHTALKNDGCILGSMYGGDTLYELRVSLQLAETEREGGFAPHVSPFTSVQDLGNLLTRAGFTMPTLDIDEKVVWYPSIFELMYDLKGMGENNCSWARRSLIPRETLMAAAAIYQKMYGEEGKEGIPATFQILNFIAWKPDPSQKGPAKRGSAQVSMKDLDKVTAAMQDQSPEDPNVQKLMDQIEKLRTSVQDSDDNNNNPSSER